MVRLSGNHVKLIGVLYLGTAVEILCLWKRIRTLIKNLEKLQLEDKLKIELINWIISEGVYLEGDEFFPQYIEKSQFINMVMDY